LKKICQLKFKSELLKTPKIGGLGVEEENLKIIIVIIVKNVGNCEAVFQAMW